MQRRREVASSPERTAGDTWQAIVELVGTTLERSPNIDRAAIDAAMDKAGGVGRMLIAGGHSESSPITVVAGSLWLEIVTVSGDRALTLDENLNPVPGAATAEDWIVHLPATGPLAKLVVDAAKTDEHLSSDEPAATPTTEAKQASSSLNEDALTRWAEEKP